MNLLLGIDLGTSYFKVGLFDSAGKLRGLGRVAVDAESPQPDRRELPVGQFWSLLRQALAHALHEAGATAREIVALSYSSQANTFLLLDGRDEPLTPFVLWTDARVETVNAELAAFSQTEDFGYRAGFKGFTLHSAPAKCVWFRENRPDLWQRTRRIMTISDYFVFALTGERVGDAGTAALLGLYDLTTQAWSTAALQAGGLETEKFSTPLRPGSAGGRTTAAAEGLMGLPPGLPMAVGSLDHHVAALGSGLGSLADISISTGTVLAALTLTDRVVPQPRTFHGPHFEGTGFFRLTFDTKGAGQLDEYQRTYAPGRSIEELVAAAGAVSAGSRSVGQPRRKALLQEHGVFVRNLLEEIASTHRTLVHRLVGPGGNHRIVATGGGARSALWLQIKADMLDLPIVTPQSPERACLGAAMLASVAGGVHPSVGSASTAMCQPGHLFQPVPAHVRLYRDWPATPAPQS